MYIYIPKIYRHDSLRWSNTANGRGERGGKNKNILYLLRSERKAKKL